MGMWKGSGNGGTFTERMFSNSFIDSPTFSMLIDRNTNAGPHYSYIEFGTLNTNSMRNVNDLTWIPNTAGNYWGNNITGFKYGSSSNASRFSEDLVTWTTQTARLSSGWYDIVGPVA